MWLYFLDSNKESSWKKFPNIMVHANISSDASVRCFAGAVDIPGNAALVTSGKFSDRFLNKDFQVKEGEALRETIFMLCCKIPHLLKGKTLLCKVYNQALKPFSNHTYKQFLVNKYMI